MNQRILDLADKAYSEYETDAVKYNCNIPDAFCLKFAELIVRECVEVLRLVPYCADDKPDFGDEVVFQEAVKKQFGIDIV